MRTAIRRFRLETQRSLAPRSPRRSWELLALSGDNPAGICTVFTGTRHAGLFDLAVVPSQRNQGIGQAPARLACGFAQEQGAEGISLLATNMGYGVYQRVGFREIARVGCWYTARP